jgi:hypothetical protein
MLSFFVSRAIALLVLLGLAAVPAAAAKRIALVIGNATYRNTPQLANPRNDADDMAAALKTLGFEVIKGVDLDKPAMDRRIRDFAEQLEGADVGLFFYAGHGLQVGGQYFLVPVDAELNSGAALDFEMVRLDLIQRTMEREAKTNVLFLDACRDNPLARNLARSLGTRSTQIGRGLAAQESGAGTLISFSTQPGNVAQDGGGRNSPFAGALLKEVLVPGEDLSSMLIKVRNDVMASTGNRQVPWEHSALRARFFFSMPPAIAAPRGTQDFNREMEITFWSTVKDSKSPAVLRTYLERYPNGTFAELAKVMIGQLEASARAAPGRSGDTGPAGQVKAGGRPDQVASLPPPASTQVPAPPAAGSPELVRALQKELARVGCDPGDADGKWGGRGRVALEEFARRTKIALSTDEPSAAALDAVTAQKGRICPLHCGSSQREVDGRCVARPNAVERKPAEAERKRPRQPQARKDDPSKHTCWSNDRLQALVPCSDPRSNGRVAF